MPWTRKANYPRILVNAEPIPLIRRQTSWPQIQSQKAALEEAFVLCLATQKPFRDKSVHLMSLFFKGIKIGWSLKTASSPGNLYSWRGSEAELLLLSCEGSMLCGYKDGHNWRLSSLTLFYCKFTGRISNLFVYWTVWISCGIQIIPYAYELKRKEKSRILKKCITYKSPIVFPSLTWKS